MEDKFEGFPNYVPRSPADERAKYKKDVIDPMRRSLGIPVDIDSKQNRSAIDPTKGYLQLEKKTNRQSAKEDYIPLNYGQGHFIIPQKDRHQRVLENVLKCSILKRYKF